MATYTGVPYQDLRWQEVEGQPFGIGAGYNGLIFGNLENIIDSEGAIAAAGSVTSNRGMSVAFGRQGQPAIPYDPFAVRFLAGGDVNIAGALTVVGNVVTGGNSFQAGLGSTYLIGKSDNPDQSAELAALYANNGSAYWAPSDNGNHYVISSYDVPRYIPAARLSANVPSFFADARASLTCRVQNIADLTANGTTASRDSGLVLTGTDAQQNVFDVNWPADGSLVGPLSIETPEGSLNIVRIYSGDVLTVTNGIWGSMEQANRTLYVLMDAKTVHMQVAAAIYGSMLAPDTHWNANPSGGNINGNTVLGSLSVPQGSGFELHWYPFAGGMTGLGECNVQPDAPSQPEQPEDPNRPGTPQCPECICQDGIISGVMLPCGCCQWRLKLQLLATRQVLSVWQGSGMGQFSFEVDPQEDYLLIVETCCHYEVRLQQLGARSLTVKG